LIRLGKPVIALSLRVERSLSNSRPGKPHDRRTPDNHFSRVAPGPSGGICDGGDFRQRQPGHDGSVSQNLNIAHQRR
jgi:hypothetical protein